MIETLERTQIKRQREAQVFAREGNWSLAMTGFKWEGPVETMADLQKITGKSGEARYIIDSQEHWMWLDTTWAERRAELVEALKDPNFDPTEWSEEEKKGLDVLLHEQFNVPCEIEIHHSGGKWHLLSKGVYELNNMPPVFSRPVGGGVF